MANVLHLWTHLDNDVLENKKLIIQFVILMLTYNDDNTHNDVFDVYTITCAGIARGETEFIIFVAFF